MFEDWITLEEATQRTGISERSFHRMIKDRKLQREYRREPGKKPIIVLDPESISSLEQRTMHPIPVEKTLETVLQGDMAALLSELLGTLREIATNTKKPEEPPYYINLTQAAKVTGLPREYLRRKVKEGAIPAILSGSYWIRREDLEQHRPALPDLRPRQD